METTLANITLVALYECLSDEGKIAKHGISPEDWAKIKADYEEDNPNESQEFDLYRDITFRTIRINLLEHLAFRMKIDPEVHEELLEEIGMPGANLEQVEREIRGLKKDIDLRGGLLKKIQPKLDKGVDFDVRKIHNAIASLEMNGFTIEDYDKLKYSKYKAMVTVVEKAQENVGKANRKRAH